MKWVLVAETNDLKEAGLKVNENPTEKCIEHMSQQYIASGVMMQFTSSDDEEWWNTKITFYGVIN